VTYLVSNYDRMVPPNSFSKQLSHEVGMTQWVSGECREWFANRLLELNVASSSSLLWLLVCCSRVWVLFLVTI